MKKNILITGGAGFIGSHLCDELLNHGYNIRVLDNLSPQVHGGNGKVPDYLNKNAEFILGDVRNKETLQKALNGIDAVFHFAAAVGVGQSMYEIEKYVSVNNIGTATLFEILINKPIAKVIIASSMSIYGEGLYRTKSGKFVSESERSVAQLKQGKWELFDKDGEMLQPVPTPETKTPALSSIYALSKYDQERMTLMLGRAYGIKAVALRFFNVFGTRQALSNPYTGVLAIFASRYLNNNPPVIFEDGGQQRDFVSVYDIVRACRLALENDKADGQVFNVGSGRPYRILEVAGKMAEVLNKENIKPVINGKYRVGDIRHCYADISLAKSVLGYEPSVSLEEGLVELSEWLKGRIAYDRVEEAASELMERGLTI